MDWKPGSRKRALTAEEAELWAYTMRDARALATFEDKDRRRISKNADMIDSRLDLHGMRQREAHGALRSFLLVCSARGDRHVLIITGKGVSLERSRDYLAEERGVLRRLVPQWLAEPDLRNLVVSYTASHVRHGGDGALYVKLRRPRAR
jgi:DNA-nicking Smr family endonuclease